jgi:hypothetical protein
MRGSAAVIFQVALTLFGIALLPTLGTSAPVLIACWTLVGIGFLVVSISIYRSRRGPSGDHPSRDLILRRHLLHLTGEMTTIKKTLDSALTAERWWDVRFNGLPSLEWAAARDVIAERAPKLYVPLVKLYAEADQLNKVANTKAAEENPAGPLAPDSRRRLESLRGEIEACEKAIRSHGAANKASGLRHPYRTLTAAVVVTAAAAVALTLVAPSLWDSGPKARLIVSNPLPRVGSPHGSGISHSEYPDGFQINGVSAPTFNSYLDNEDRSPDDERPFLAARVLRPVRAPAQGLSVGFLNVRPGDTVQVSIYIRNDADPAGNHDGRGPAIARNTRVLAGWNRKRATVLSLGSYIFAENAVPDLAHPDLKTISANLELRSQTERPIRLEYVPNSAQYLQNAPERGKRVPGLPLGTYETWDLTPAQQRMLFTGYTRGVHGNSEMDAASGLPVGSDDGYRRATLLGDRLNDRMNFYGGSPYFGYVVYRARVLAATSR